MAELADITGLDQIIKQTQKYTPLLYPPRIRPGDTIACCCPAGPVHDKTRLEAGVRILRDMGFHVRMVADQVSKSNSQGYLAGSDQYRAQTLQQIWLDDEVKAVMAIRGGYGCLRMVELLDMQLLARHPKLLIGFSDLTVLHAALQRHAGMVSIHGPMLTTLASTDHDYRAGLFALLTGDFSRWSQRAESSGKNEVEVLNQGAPEASGHLIGGNLATLAHLLGTPWEPVWENAILILEDTGEQLYRLDRFLTHLHSAGRLSQINGLILGSFDPGVGVATAHDARLELLRLQEAVWERVLALVHHHAGKTGKKIPVWGNFPVGHLQKNLALPMGMQVTMEAQSAELRLHPQSLQGVPG